MGHAAQRHVVRNTPKTYTSGVIVPYGALDRWYAYCATGGATRREFVGFGDSTMFGANDDGTGQHYSWLQRIRDRWVAAYGTDGGKGMFGGGEGFTGIVYDAPEINGQVSTTVSGIADGYDNLAGQDYFSTTANEAVTLQFRSTDARLWYVERGSAGEFTYSVNGAAAQTVNAHGTGSPIDKFVYLSGLAANTTHTVVITNKGGRAALPPASCSASLGAFSGSLSINTTYYYVATYTFGGGETVASPVASATVAGTAQTIGVQIPDVGQDSATLYRGTSSGGPFGKMTGVTGTVGGSVVSFTDNGSVTPTMGTNPPTTGTSNLNTSSRMFSVAFAPINTTGLSVQKHATNGGTIVNTFHGGLAFSQALHSATRYQTPLGLAPSDSGYAIDTSYPSGQRVKPIVAVYQLGFNDLSNTNTAADYDNFQWGVEKFADACQAAGCDGVVASGQLPYHTKWPTHGANVYTLMRDTALRRGLAFVDLFKPIGGLSLNYTGGTSTPHLTKAKYQAQADFLWDSVLNV